MRDYAKLSPTFWTGTTGKALRRHGVEATLVALYLVSAPGSNMLGLYYQPVLFMAHETGLGFEGASKGLQGCIEAGFCRYDAETEMVFVHEMAAWQIAESLAPKDLRCKGLQRDYDSLPDCPFLGAWFDRYSKGFNLTGRRENGSPLQAPSKPLPSQEQEQEQEQKTKTTRKRAAPAVLVSVDEMVADGVDRQNALDWLTNRKAKKLPLTPSSWSDAKAEAGKAGMTIAEAIQRSAAQGWGGFKAKWLTEDNGRNGQKPVVELWAGAK